MPDDSIWIAVTSDGTVTAWDDVDAARNHLRDDDGEVWVEHVTINRTPVVPQEAAGAPSVAGDDEDVPGGPPTAHSAAYRRTWMAAPRLIYPERPRGETA